MSKMRFLMVAIAASVAMNPTPTFAADDETGIWTIVSMTDAFQTDDGPSRWLYWFDAQARYVEFDSGANQWLVRPGIGYQINDKLRGWVGYARLRNRNAAGRVTDENRYWQQLDWPVGRFGRGQVTMRARLEQRSLSSGDDLGVVLRLMTRYQQPVGENLRLSLSLEPFVDLRDTDWGGDSGLAQNRLTVGLGWPLNDRVSLEAAYMNQYVWVDNGRERMNHIGLLNFRIKL